MVDFFSADSFRACAAGLYQGRTFQNELELAWAIIELYDQCFIR